MGADRSFPGFEETLALAALPAEGRAAATRAPGTEGAVAFDATIARGIGALPTLALGGAGRAEAAALPPISVDLRAPSTALPLASFSPPAPEVAPDGASADLRVLRLLGQGGMGQVHLAEQRSLMREVALKTVHPGSHEGAAVALCDEALVTGQIEHPSVIPVHALGRADDGRPVMVMKRVEGVSWKTLLATPDHPIWENVSGSHGLTAHLQFLVQVCHAVAYAHSRGFVHRDLKPENVMIGRFGEVYVVDWGLAQKLGTPAPAPGEHQIVGTPAYMAPEMVAGHAIDERTDVFLLGAILHELLTGEPPHHGETLMLVLAAAYESAPKTFDRSVPEELAALCRDALARDPADRPRSAKEFQARLVSYLQHRASSKLARRATERLRSVEGFDESSAEQRLEIRRALTECRFAFHQALEEWPDNRIARDGLRACAARSVRVELADGHLAAAKVALEALDGPPEELVRGVEALEARLARERAEAERLRRIAHDMDATVGATSRRRAATFVALLCAVVSAVVMLRSRHAGPLTPPDMVRIAAFMVVTMGALVGIFRKRLLRNAFGKKVAYLAFLASATMLVHRVLAMLAQQEVHVILATDSLLFTVLLVAAGITLAPWFALGAVFTLGGAFAILAYPAHGPLIFTLATLAMTIVSALMFRPSPPGDAVARETDPPA